MEGTGTFGGSRAAGSGPVPIDLPPYAVQLRPLALASLLVAAALLHPFLALAAGIGMLLWLAAADPSGASMRRFLVLSLGFPIYIAAGGRDLGTVSSVLILVAAVIRLLQSGKGESRFPPALLILAAATVVPLALPLFTLPQDALGPALRRLAAMGVNLSAFWFVLSTVRTREDLIDTVQAFHLTIAVTAAIMLVTVSVPGTGTLLRVFGHRGSEEFAVAVQDDIVRAMGPLGDYELAAELMAIGMLLAAGLAVAYRTGGGWRGYAASLVLMLLALGSTATRGALIAFGAGLLVFLLAGRRLRLVRLQGLLLPAVFAAGLLVVFVTLIGTESILLAFGRRLARTEFEGLVPDTRLFVWAFYLPRILESPWLGTGLALHTFEDAPYDPHSLWIHLLLAGGVPALALFLLFAAVLTVRSLRALLRAPVVFRSDAVLLAVAAAAVAFVVDQWKITYLRLENYQHMMWVLFGICGAAGSVAARGTRGPGEDGHE